jgi:hypothetical protein
VAPLALRDLLLVAAQDGPEGDNYFSFTYITGDETALRFIIMAWAQVALSCLDLLSYVLPSRFREKLIIKQTIPMRQGL